MKAIDQDFREKLIERFLGKKVRLSLLARGFEQHESISLTYEHALDYDYRVRRRLCFKRYL